MSAFFFSTESQSPAAQMMIACFLEIEKNMQVESLEKYTDAISKISIIHFGVEDEFKARFDCRERKYIGWKRKEADIRLFVPFVPFVQATKEEKMMMCQEVIKTSLAEIQARCKRKKVCFDLESLLNDIFPGESFVSGLQV